MCDVHSIDISYSDNDKIWTLIHWSTEIILATNHIFRLLRSSATASANYYHPCDAYFCWFTSIQPAAAISNICERKEKATKKYRTNLQRVRVHVEQKQLDENKQRKREMLNDLFRLLIHLQAALPINIYPINYYTIDPTSINLPLL